MPSVNLTQKQLKQFEKTQSLGESVVFSHMNASGVLIVFQVRGDQKKTVGWLFPAGKSMATTKSWEDRLSKLATEYKDFLSDLGIFPVFGSRRP